MTAILVGTDDGLHRLDGEAALRGAAVDDVAVGWVAAGGTVHRRNAAGWSDVGAVDGLEVTCVAPIEDGAIAGTGGAHLVAVGDGPSERVASFDDAPTRGEWHTPWGGPPAVRSISVSPDGTRYVNVHVGGILRSDADTWAATIDLHTDVHQVLAIDGWVLAALGVGGLGISRDRGASWSFDDDGLHATYCRAIAVAGNTILLSASTGPGGRRAAVYRRPLDGEGSFERCVAGLPEWFNANVDTHCLAADGDLALIGARSGEVYRSEDAGMSWERIADGLPPIRCVALSDAGT
ncbi:MAG: WD40/YVTN/BNR-like repeat-containing protein [Nitriliruptorales bacterium]